MTKYFNPNKCAVFEIRITNSDILIARENGHTPALVVALERLGITTRTWSGNWVEFFVNSQSIGDFLITRAWTNAMARKPFDEKPKAILLKDPYRDTP